MTGSRAAAARGHARHRALERFGLEVGKATRQALLHQVRSRQFKFARKLTHSRTVIVAEHAGIEITFIYSSTRKDIVTFLPANARETLDFRNRTNTKERHHVNPLPCCQRSNGSRYV